MTTKVTVSDAALETMLARRARRADPVGLADAVSTALETIEPRRGPSLGVPDWWLPGRPSRGLAWILVAASLLLALLGSALVGSGLLDRHGPLTSLVPTGIDTVTSVGGADQRVVADGNGTLWAFWPGNVARFDPATGDRRTWTVSADLAFGFRGIAPARAGGVWIWSNTSIRRFTGEGFAESFPTRPAYISDFAEAPDGSFWAASSDRGLERWDGSGWVPTPAGRPSVMPGALLVGRNGDVWVANLDPSVGDGGVVGKGVSHFETGTWTTYDAVRDTSASFPGGLVTAIEEAANGSVWVLAGAGANGGAHTIARFDGGTWTRIDGPGFAAWSLDTAPDGSVWVAGSPEYAPAVARYANGQWTTYGAEDGIVGAVGPVSAMPAGTFLATDRGLLRFVDGRWATLWPDMATGPAMYTIADRLLAVSADEAWAANERGIWHFVDGGWTWPVNPAGWTARTHNLALGADGTLWAATSNGVAALRDGTWTVASTRAAWSIAIAPDGTAWAGDAREIVGLRLDGTPPRRVTCPVGKHALAVTADGTVYVGQISWSGRPGLARFDGRTCEKVDPIGDGRMVEVIDLDADPTGGLVAVMFRQESPSTGPTTSYVARLDGERWTILEELTTEDTYMYDGGVSLSPDGEIWRSGWRSDGAGMERYTGGRWIPVGIGSFGPPSIAEDGTLWFVGSSGVQRLRGEDVRP